MFLPVRTLRAVLLSLQIHHAYLKDVACMLSCFVFRKQLNQNMNYKLTVSHL